MSIMLSGLAAFGSSFAVDSQSIESQGAVVKANGSLLASAKNTYYIERAFYGKVFKDDLTTREVQFGKFNYLFLENWDENFDYENPELLSPIYSTNSAIATYNNRFEFQFVQYANNKKFLAIVINYVVPNGLKKKESVMLFLVDIPVDTRRARILNVQSADGSVNPYKWTLELGLNEQRSSFDMKYSLEAPTYVEFHHGLISPEYKNVFMARQ